jgi:SAM-dependent methyltransferase
MLQRLPSHSEVERRERERAEADTLYNDALTALDGALPPPAPPPSPPPSPDQHQLAALNQQWEIIPRGTRPAPGRGLRSRLAHFVWHLVEPYLERQQAFNAILVDHVNRSLRSHHELIDYAAGLARTEAEASASLAQFHSRLIQYAQQITLYIDTRDRAAAAGLRAVIDALTDEFLRGSESLRARERRLDDIRDALGALQQRTLMLKREIERQASVQPAGTAEPGAANAASGSPAGGSAAAIDSYKYVGFEDLFRGPEAEVRQRQAEYVDDFRASEAVLDIGCGRGEFLDLLREAGIRARGIDVNRAMVQACRERGLDAEEADALAYLSSLPDGSLGGLFAAQVVEHLEPDYLMRLLETAYHKLRPGSSIVLETINPGCWIAFFDSYIRDLPHVRPVHPDTLKYLLGASGFQDLAIRYRAPYPEDGKLRTMAAAQQEPPSVHARVDTHNANVARLNALMFSYLDYAAVGIRP